MRRKFLVLMSRHGLGGDEINLMRLLGRMDRSRLEPLVLLPKDSEGLRARLTERGVETWQRTMPAWRKPKGWPAQSLYIGEIVWEIYKRQIDLVMALNINESPSAVLSGWFSGRPSIVWFQDSLISAKKTRSYLLHRADIVVAISQAMREKVQALSARGRTVVIPNGIDTGHFDPRRYDRRLRQELSIAPDALVLGMVGRLVESKGQLFLIRALGLLKQRGLRPRLLLLGSEKPHYRAELNRAIAEYGLEDQVLFLGFREDIASVLAAIDLFVLLSVNEAFSLAMGEAMAMEKPCVYGPVGGVNELVGEEDVGIAVERDRPEQIAEAIERLAGNPEERARQGRAGRRQIAEHFSLDLQARRFEDFLVKV